MFWLWKRAVIIVIKIQKGGKGEKEKFSFYLSSPTLKNELVFQKMACIRLKQFFFMWHEGRQLKYSWWNSKLWKLCLIYFGNHVGINSDMIWLYMTIYDYIWLMLVILFHSGLQITHCFYFYLVRRSSCASKLNGLSWEFIRSFNCHSIYKKRMDERENTRSNCQLITDRWIPPQNISYTFSGYFSSVENTVRSRLKASGVHLKLAISKSTVFGSRRLIGE